MSTENIDDLCKILPVTPKLNQDKNGKIEDKQQTLDENSESKKEEKQVESNTLNLDTKDSLPENDKDKTDEKEKEVLKTKAIKTIVKKGSTPGNLSPLSKKLRRDSLRTQLKRACTLALTEQPKTSATLKTRGRRHSTGTSKDSTKKPVVKRNLRKTLGNTTMKRKRENSTDQSTTEEIKSVDDVGSVKDPKFRRKSNESLPSAPTTQTENCIQNEKEVLSSSKTSSDLVKLDSNITTSPARARRSTRLSPETIPKSIIGKKRGRPSRGANQDPNFQEDLNKVQIEQKESDDTLKSGEYSFLLVYFRFSHSKCLRPGLT